MLAEFMREACADPCFPLRYSDHVDGPGAPFFRHVRRLGLEGMISKRAAGLDKSGRSKGWLKIKNFERSELVVIGRVRMAGRPEEMLLAEPEKAGLRFVGRAFNVLRRAERERLTALLDASERKTPPIAGLRAREVAWMEPRHVLTVRHLATSGALRHATLEGLKF